jgi:hypothetical protein
MTTPPLSTKAKLCFSDKEQWPREGTCVGSQVSQAENLEAGSRCLPSSLALFPCGLFDPDETTIGLCDPVFPH